MALLQKSLAFCALQRAGAGPRPSMTVRVRVIRQPTSTPTAAVAPCNVTSLTTQICARAEASAPVLAATVPVTKLLPLSAAVETDSVCSPSVETLEQLLQDSVVEIVKNIKEAPFLNYVFDADSSQSVNRLRIIRRRVSGDEWPFIRNAVREACPDAIILVQKLENSDSDSDVGLENQKQEKDDEEGFTQMWGVLIEGRNTRASACYILKTTTVKFCTYFCLTRAQCFGPSPSCQLANSWLHFY